MNQLFLKILHESWESLVTLQLQSDYSVVFPTVESEQQSTFNFCTNPTRKEKVSYMEMSRENDQKTKNQHLWKNHMTMTKKDAYISNKLQLQNLSLTFIHKSKSLLSATSILSCLSMAYNTPDSLDRLTCIDAVEYAKCQDTFEQISWSKKMISITWM